MTPPAPTTARPSYALAALLAAVGAVFVLLPIFHAPWWNSHDKVAYPVRLIEFAHAWYNGEIWPRWAPELYGGYGAPLFNFYPPGAVAPAAPFFLLGMTAYRALKISLWFFTAIGLFGAFLTGELVGGRRDAGFLAYAVFAVAPYRACQLFARGDIAEYSATAVALLTLYLWLAVHRRGPTIARCLAAAAAHAGIMLTHTLTGQWSTEILALLVGWWIVGALRRGDRDRALVYAVTFLGALGLMSIYVLPAIAERGLVRIEDMAKGAYATEKNFVLDFKLFTSPGFFFVGYPLLVCVPGAIIALATVAEKRREVALWLGVCVVLLALMTPIAAPAWHLLPFGHFIMFPWRLLLFLTIGLTVLSAVLWPIAAARRTRATDIALLVLGLLLVGRTYAEQTTPEMTEAERIPRGYVDLTRGIFSTVVFNEYLPLTVPKAPRFPPMNLVSRSSDELTVTLARRTGTKMRIIVDAKAPGWMLLSTYAFPGWRLRNLALTNASLAPDPSGLLRVELPAAGHYDVSVSFRNTPIRTAATLVSVLTLGLLPAALWWLLRRRKADAA